MAHEDIHISIHNNLSHPINLTLTEEPDINIETTLLASSEVISLNLVEEDPVIIDVSVLNQENIPVEITVFDPLFSNDQSFHINGDLSVEGTISASKLIIDGIEIDPSGALQDQVLIFDGSKFIPSTVSINGGGGGGTGESLTVKYTTIVPHGNAEVVIDHNLGSVDVDVYVYETTNGNTIYCGVERTSSNSITLTFDSPPLLNEYRVSVIHLPVTISTGGGSGSSRFEYSQTTPSSQWVIAHSLNGYPLVSVTDSSGDQVLGDVTYPNSSEVIINFTAAFTGTASLI